MLSAVFSHRENRQLNNLIYQSGDIMYVLSQQANRVVILNGNDNGWARNGDLAKAKSAYMSLFEITRDDSRTWTPAERRTWLDFITKFDHARFGRHLSSSCSVNGTALIHTFFNCNTDESLVVIAGAGILNSLYWHCKNGEDSQVIDL